MTHLSSRIEDLDNLSGVVLVMTHLSSRKEELDSLSGVSDEVIVDCVFRPCSPLRPCVQSQRHKITGGFNRGEIDMATGRVDQQVQVSKPTHYGPCWFLVQNR
ncbi:unnamed protein product [Ectocarpus sp. 4 AP-2014]